MQLIDTAVLREYLGPDGAWAREAGSKIKDLRSTFNGMSEEDLAGHVGVSVTTIKSIESGRIVPRDYLRAAIAGTLCRDVADIWPPMRCERIRTMALEVA